MAVAVIESVAAGIQLVLAGVLTIVAYRAYRRVRARRMLWLAVAFVGFLLQGLLLAWGLFTTQTSLETAVAAGLLLNTGALAAIYLGVLRP